MDREATRSTRREAIEIVVLLLAVLGFLAVVVPAGIVDPPGFGFDQGLPPSFSAYLAGALAAVILLGRLLQVGLGRTGGVVPVDAGPDQLGADDETAVSRPLHSLAGMAAAVLFAAVLIPVLGFYAAGWTFLVAVLLLLGERRPLFIAVPPLLVMALVWGLFDRLLEIRLPVGLLFGG